jgi:hypothetical protein
VEKTLEKPSNRWAFRQPLMSSGRGLLVGFEHNIRARRLQGNRGARRKVRLIPNRPLGPRARPGHSSKSVNDAPPFRAQIGG